MGLLGRLEVQATGQSDLLHRLQRASGLRALAHLSTESGAPIYDYMVCDCMVCDCMVCDCLVCDYLVCDYLVCDYTVCRVLRYRSVHHDTSSRPTATAKVPAHFDHRPRDTQAIVRASR